MPDVGTEDHPRRAAAVSQAQSAAAEHKETQTRQRVKERAPRSEERVRAGLPRLVQQLAELGAERVILFGSRAAIAAGSARLISL